MGCPRAGRGGPGDTLAGAPLVAQHFEAAECQRRVPHLARLPTSDLRSPPRILPVRSGSIRGAGALAGNGDSGVAGTGRRRRSGFS